MNVEIKTLGERRVATLPHVGPYGRISEAFARLGEIAGPSGLIGPHTAMLGIFLDDPRTTPASELRSEAGIVISPSSEIPAGLGERRLPAGRYGCTTHVGPYEALGDVWARFKEDLVQRNGQRTREGLSYEVYWNTPAEVPKEKLETELYVPIV